nr:LysR family transcriptional regulator substrate-binding protein [Nocardioides marinisabuli]
MRPHAEQVLAAIAETERAVASVRSLETGTIRFGMFGIARLYAGSALIADVLERYPGVRVELVGQNSTEVVEDLRRGRLEAAMLAISAVDGEGISVRPVAREELVYISADPEHLTSPVTAHRLAQASLVMPETTYRAVDSTRATLRQMLHETGRNPQSRIEVEDVETAVELVGMGLADSVIPRGAAEQLLPRLAPRAGFVSLRPRQFDTFAIVHRSNAVLSPAARLMIDLATRRMQAIAEPINPR